MKMKRRLFVAIALLVTIFFIENSFSQAKEVRGVSDKSIKIGLMMDQTGPAASILVPLTQAVRTYARYVNEHGGIHGRELKILVEDDRYSIPPAIAGFKKLVYKDKIFAFIGPGSASLLYTLWKKMEDERLPSIAAASTELAVKPHKKYLFIFTDTYEGQMRVLIDYMVKDCKIIDPKVGLVYPDTEAGKTDLRAALPRLQKYGIQPVTKEILMAGSLDASSQVMSLKRYGVNCVLSIGTISQTAVTLLRELKKFGLKIPVFFSYGAMLGEELNHIGDTASQAYIVHAISPWYGDGSGVAKMREITLKYFPGTEKPYRGTAYTGGWGVISVLAEGIRRAGRNLDEEALIEALESFKDYDTGGLVAPITFSSKNHRAANVSRIYKVDLDAGKFVALTDWRKSE